MLGGRQVLGLAPADEVAGLGIDVGRSLLLPFPVIMVGRAVCLILKIAS